MLISQSLIEIGWLDDVAPISIDRYVRLGGVRGEGDECGLRIRLYGFTEFINKSGRKSARVLGGGRENPRRTIDYSSAPRALMCRGLKTCLCRS